MEMIRPKQGSKEFLECWSAAAQHVCLCGDESLRWLKSDPFPPYLDHISFFYGNQAFFIFLEDVNHCLEIPGSKENVLRIARGWDGYACLLPMKKTLSSGWQPKYPAWGLIDLEIGRQIDPPSLVTDEEIECTDWELYDFACQIVRSDIEQKGYKIMSVNRDIDIMPSLWFVGPTGEEWVQIVVSRFPETSGELPQGFDVLETEFSRLGYKGHLARVHFSHSTSNPDSPRIIRGQGANVRYKGLEPIE